jgi:hypothetical protein
MYSGCCGRTGSECVTAICALSILQPLAHEVGPVSLYMLRPCQSGKNWTFWHLDHVSPSGGGDIGDVVRVVCKEGVFCTSLDGRRPANLQYQLPITKWPHQSEAQTKKIYQTAQYFVTV